MYADSEGPAAAILTGATQILAPVIGEEFVFVGGQVDRGGVDPLRSEDLEDIISVVAGRPEILPEIQAGTAELRSWLADKANELLGEGLVSYAIEGTLTDATLVPGTVEEVLGRFRAIAALGEDR